ncbi:Imm63 family immunity protein [Aeoliella mucimassa]|uniref:Imm63 family immunity protein n=1 Tax=Aeoliella mucimassa TaxID=2527972 RepID=UPI0011A8DED0
MVFTPELQRQTTADAEELLFWLVTDLTCAMATDWELRHRIEGEDFRRQQFRKHVELLSLVSEEWCQRQSQAYERILAEHSFRD